MAPFGIVTGGKPMSIPDMDIPAMCWWSGGGGLVGVCADDAPASAAVMTSAAADRRRRSGITVWVLR
jgi:hypothetical protein